MEWIGIACITLVALVWIGVFIVVTNPNTLKAVRRMCGLDENGRFPKK